MARDVLRVGVVGVGNIAAIAQLPTLAGRSDVELTAVVTRRADPSPIMTRWPFRASFATVDDMLAGAEIDAAFVLTPRHEHAAAVHTLLSSGVDVFCEKPLALTSAEAEDLADRAEAAGRVLMVGLNRRFAPMYADGRQRFGETGASFCIAQKNRHGSEYRATFENAIHMVDLLRWYCGGEVESVTAHAIAPDPWREDGLTATIRFDNGHCGVLMAARNAGRWDETIDAYGQGKSVRVEAPERLVVADGDTVTLRESRSEALGWPTATTSFGFSQAVLHFLDRVRDRSQPLTCGREAALTQRLMERILTAAGLPLVEDPTQEWVSNAQ